MSDVFRELTPQEIQQAVLQFMGQNMGELKELDSNLINKNSTLQGMTLRPGDVMRSIPAPAHPQTMQVNIPPQPQIVPNVIPSAPTVTIHQPIIDITPQQQQPVIDPNDPVQMEFNFNQTSYAKNIFESLRQIETTLNSYGDLLQEIQKKVNLLIEQGPIKKKKTEKPLESN